jgi:hypothetical protein
MVPVFAENLSFSQAFAPEIPGERGLKLFPEKKQYKIP